jgi:hypothetical protein
VLVVERHGSFQISTGESDVVETRLVHVLSVARLRSSAAHIAADPVFWSPSQMTLLRSSFGYVLMRPG